MILCFLGNQCNVESILIKNKSSNHWNLKKIATHLVLADNQHHVNINSQIIFSSFHQLIAMETVVIGSIPVNDNIHGPVPESLHSCKYTDMGNLLM